MGPTGLTCPLYTLHRLVHTNHRVHAIYIADYPVRRSPHIMNEITVKILLDLWIRR